MDGKDKGRDEDETEISTKKLLAKITTMEAKAQTFSKTGLTDSGIFTETKVYHKLFQGLYHTDKQVARVNQIVGYFTMARNVEYDAECVVTDVAVDANGEYWYTIVGLKSKRIYRHRFIWDSDNGAEGFSTSYKMPRFLDREQVEVIKNEAAILAERERKQEEKRNRFLHDARIVEYSEKCLAIFTDDANDAVLLASIHAKRNEHLTWEGKKVAGWIFPKYRKEELAALVSATPWKYIH